MPEQNTASARSVASREVSYLSRNERVVGTWFEAASEELAGARGTPAVVMAHGLSMTRDSGLARYAERFAAAGMHVLTFDYRSFGDSAGAPREWVSVQRQVQDYHAALKYVRAQPGVDPARVALWGTSYSGGIALQCAYEDRNHAALVLQVPNVDNAATGLFLTTQFVRKAPLRGLWLAARAVLDAGAGLVGLPAVYTPAMGVPGEWAAYVNEESMRFIDTFKGPAWKNRIALRDFVRLPIFRPGRHAADVPGPIMIITAERDDLTPVGPILAVAKRAGDRAELHRYDVSHFAVYTGALYEELVTKEVAFLRKHLA
jgi:dienelactone hydrolase